LRLIISAYLFKVAYEVLATPLTYAIVNFLKRAEGVDKYDYNTRFTPSPQKYKSSALWRAHSCVRIETSPRCSLVIYTTSEVNVETSLRLDAARRVACATSVSESFH